MQVFYLEVAEYLLQNVRFFWTKQKILSSLTHLFVSEQNIYFETSFSRIKHYLDKVQEVNHQRDLETQQNFRSIWGKTLDACRTHNLPSVRSCYVFYDEHELEEYLEHMIRVHSCMCNYAEIMQAKWVSR